MGNKKDNIYIKRNEFRIFKFSKNGRDGNKMG